MYSRENIDYRRLYFVIKLLRIARDHRCPMKMAYSKWQERPNQTKDKKKKKKQQQQKMNSNSTIQSKYHSFTCNAEIPFEGVFILILADFSY